MLVTFGPPISVQNMSDPWFYAGIPAVYTETPAVYTTIYLFGFDYDGKVYGQVPVGCLQSAANDITCKMRGWEGRVGAHWWKNVLCECASEIILAQNLLRQSEAWYWTPVWLPVPQGNGKASSGDHAGVWHRGRNCDPDVDPPTYVWNGFLEFSHHELTQICKYNKSLLPKHAIYW